MRFSYQSIQIRHLLNGKDNTRDKCCQTVSANNLPAASFHLPVCVVSLGII